MTTRLNSVVRLLVPAFALAAMLAGAQPAEAQTAQALYERALAREQAARRAAGPSLASLRSIATAYENVVRRHPRSGYADNALWQGAGVLQLAWDRDGQTRDRDQAIKLLEWLRREYPSSSLVRESRTRTTALNRPRAASTARAAAAPTPRPATPAAIPTARAEAASTPAATAPPPAAAPAPERAAPTAESAAPPQTTSALAAVRAASRAAATGASAAPTTAAPAPQAPAAEAAAPRPTPASTAPVPSTPATLSPDSRTPPPARRGDATAPSRENAAPAATPAAAAATPRSSTAPAPSPAARTTAPAPAPPAASTAASRNAPTPATPAPAAASNAAVAVRGLSHTPLPRGDRLTLELSAETALVPGGTSGTSAVVLTVADARAASAIVEAARSIRGSLIESLHIDNVADGLRMTVAVPDDVRHSAFALYNPNRLVLDFETLPTAARPQAALPGADSAAVASTAAERVPSAPVPAAPAAAMSVAVATAVPSSTPSADDDDAADASPSPLPPSSIRGGYSLARQLGLGVSRIVIDPGHGGSDPGASGNGVTEAALVLDVALRLEKLLLDQPGFEVVLTRRTNAAVPLARRTAIANDEGADLFLSIHANSSPRRETAGVETYFLNLATNPQAEAVAARENASSAGTMHTLPQLVRAITNNNKLAESRELAGVVQSSLVRRLRSRNQGFQDLGVKQAPFMVLIGAQMPSVLAEIAFLTNRTEANLLKQNAYKQQIAQALFDAIVQYRGSLKKMTTVATTAEGR